MRVQVLSIRPIGRWVTKYLRSVGDKVVIKNPDMILSCYWNKIFTDFSVPIINFHPGYLPWNRGVHSYIWPLVDGTPAGVTLHWVNEKIDQGDIIVQKRVKVYSTDIAEDLIKRCTDEMFRLFVKTWPKIRRGKIKSRKQKGKGSYHWTKDITSFQEFDKWTMYRLRACTFKNRTYGYFYDNGKMINVGIKFFNKHG